MFSGPFLRTLVLAVPATLLAGCSQPSPIFSRFTTVGTLKTSLSHLEFENQQLRSRVTTLESENRDIENRLVQEESANGDLSARLDDARDMLSQRGASWGDAAGGLNHDPAPARALPAGRSSRPQRKPPFAQIPGRVDSGPPSSGFDDPFYQNPLPSSDALGPQSFRDDDSQWLPIARGTSTPATKVR